MFGGYAALWIEQRHDLRQRTAEDYRDLIRWHLDPTFKNTRLGNLTPNQVRIWYVSLSAKHAGRAHKAYRLLRAILNTAVADERIGRNPCTVRGAAQDQSAEREIPTVAEVEAVAEAMPERHRLFVPLAAWCGLRRGELLALRRRDVDLVHGSARVERTVHQLRDGSLTYGAPKTDAGRRTVHFPPFLADQIVEHLDAYVGADPDALLFTGEQGGPLRVHVLQGEWRRARTKVGVSYRMHDLRHLGATLAAATGASTREFMRRMGHASPQAALIYQHATEDRDKAIAEALAELSPVAKVSRLTAG